MSRYQHEVPSSCNTNVYLSDTVEDKYLKEFNNKYTKFLAVTFFDLLEHLLERYGKITTTDLKYNNQRINEPIDSSLTINKHFEKIDDCIQFADDGKTPYTATQFIYKAHHMILASIMYLDACKEWWKNTATNQTWIGTKKFFADEYHDLNLTQKRSTGNIRYASTDNVVLNRDIASTLDKLVMYAYADQSDMDHLIATIFQMT